MDAVEAGLDTVTTVALLTGTAASHLSMPNVGGIVSMIVKLALTARRNKECEQLAGRVRLSLGLLPYLEGPEKKANRAPLEELAATILETLAGTLLDALELVKSCQSGSMVRRVFTSNLQASKLADVQSKIDSYLLVFPLISHIKIIAGLDQIRINNTGPQSPTSLPPPPPASQPVYGATQDDITWADVPASSTVTMVSKVTGGTMVYKATLQDGRHVAIKSFDGHEAEFRVELVVVSGLHHEHIVGLLCWWEGEGKRLIVYDYVTTPAEQYKKMVMYRRLI